MIAGFDVNYKVLIVERALVMRSCFFRCRCLLGRHQRRVQEDQSRMLLPVTIIIFGIAFIVAVAGHFGYCYYQHLL